MASAIWLLFIVPVTLSGCASGGGLTDPGIDASLVTSALPATGDKPVAMEPHPSLSSAGTIQSDERLDSVTIANAVSAIKAGGQPIEWANPATGSSGMIHGITERKLEGGVLCRDFAALRTSYDGVRNYVGSACMGASGAWQVTRFESV